MLTYKYYKNQVQLTSMQKIIVFFKLYTKLRTSTINFLLMYYLKLDCNSIKTFDFNLETPRYRMTHIIKDIYVTQLAGND